MKTYRPKLQYATRIYGRNDGLEYTGDVYPTLAQARKGAREAIREYKLEVPQQYDYHIHEWRDAYGEIVAGSDI